MKSRNLLIYRIGIILGAILTLLIINDSGKSDPSYLSIIIPLLVLFLLFCGLIWGAIVCILIIIKQLKDNPTSFKSELKFIGIGLVIFVIIYLGPVLLMGAKNFITKVFLGEMNLSEYSRDINIYSFEPVNIFYLEKADQIKQMLYRLQN